MSESAAIESSLNLQILELENEVKNLKQELDRVKNERDTLNKENGEMAHNRASSANEMAQLRNALRESTIRETQYNNELSSVEEDNVMLQKAVSNLKSSQVEFEGAKHEIRQLSEEIEVLNSQVEELCNLKKIAEKQLEEALEALQVEREAKYALKKELDSHINRESMFNISNLAYSIRSMEDNHSSTNSDGEEDNMTLKRIEADLTDMKSPESNKGDLFSEIHLNELKKLEKQLEVLENEKTHLTTNLRDAQTNLDKSQNEVQNFKSRINVLTAHVDALILLKKQVDSKEEPKTKDEHDIINEKLKNVLDKYMNWFSISSKEIDGLKTDLSELQKGLNYSDPMVTLRNEITNLKNKLHSSEQKSLDLSSDVQTLADISQNAGQSLGSARSTLAALSDDLAQLYHLVCTVNGEQPKRVLLDHKNEDMRYLRIRLGRFNLLIKV